MSHYILKAHKAKGWLNIIALIDVLSLGLVAAGVEFTGGIQLLSNLYLIVFASLLFITNVWFIMDYIHSTASRKSDRYRKDYIERQVRFALVCHVYDPAKSNDVIYFSKFGKARTWFFDKFKIDKAFRDEIAVCMTTVDGCYKENLDFADDLHQFMDGHPINGVYYSGISYANKSFPYLQTSSKFSDKRENGMTLLFVCETSYEFFEEQVESKLKNCLYHQDKAVFPLTKLFDSTDMTNKLSIRLEYHPLRIG